MIALLLGLSTAIAWGLSDYFGTKASRASNPVHTAAMVFILSAILYVPSCLLLVRPSFPSDPVGVALAMGAGVFVALGYLSFFRGLSRGPVTVVSAVGSAYPLITTCISMGVFAARPSPPQLLGVGLILFGLVASSGIDRASRVDLSVGPGLRCAFLTFVFWGIDSALLDQAGDRLGWAPALCIQMLGAVVTFGLVLPLGGSRPSRRDLVTLLRSSDQWTASLLYVLGAVAFNIGLSRARGDGGIIVTALSATYPALTILLAVQRLHEKLRPVILAGAAITILGTVTLSWR